ncbi:acyltransferase [Saccharopolyspora taberi]|uniref:Acyltransferase n=1 Tax=Saccharopolyspora taberi TaxID=60895 RepID=A0ABN3VG39_9PSEU
MITVQKTAPPNGAQNRDPVLDLVRAGCLVVVVVLHAVMAGITVDAGGIDIVNAVDDQDWFTPVSWFVQVMPLFFIVGGFAGITQWRRMRDKGGTAVEFVHGRLNRLARPALIAFAMIGLGLVGAGLAGVPGDLIAQVGYRMGQPMWFLGVYLGVSALVPVLARGHESAPRTVLAGLLSLALSVDLLAARTGITALGFLNLAFVWLALQQLGFWYADGWLRDCSRRRLLGAAISALGVLLIATAAGPYSANMYVNLNPPTACLVLLGFAQLCLVALATPRLRSWLDRSRVRRSVDALGARSLSVYLWHMPALVLLAAMLLVLRAPWPDLFGASWWLTRVPWIAGIGLITFALVAVFGRFERRSRSASGAGAFRAGLGVLVAIGGVAAVLVTGFSAVSAAAGAALLAGAIRLTRSQPVERGWTRQEFELAARSV